jgi:AraC-like DNA-binding protein
MSAAPCSASWASGLTYRGSLEKTRCDLALRYLDDLDKTVTDITFPLGFSEQSAHAPSSAGTASPPAYREQSARAC